MNRIRAAIAAAESAAMELAQRRHPEGRVNSCNDTGPVDFIADMPQEPLPKEDP
jgi:hypothetical protein